MRQCWQPGHVLSAELWPQELGVGHSLCPMQWRLLSARNPSAASLLPPPPAPCRPPPWLCWGSMSVTVGPWEQGWSWHPGCTQPQQHYGLGLHFVQMPVLSRGAAALHYPANSPLFPRLLNPTLPSWERCVARDAVPTTLALRGQKQLWEWLCPQAVPTALICF